MKTKSDNKTRLDTEYLLLDTFSEYLIIKGYTKKTQQSILDEINRFTQWATTENIEIQNISYNDILAYINHCKKQGNKQRTQQLKVGYIKHYYNFLMSEKEIEDNPCTNINIKNVKRKTLYETFTAEELEKIYKNYQSANPITHKRNKVTLGLIIYQAIRTEELARLTVQDIKPREGKVIIEGSKRTNERTLKLETFQVFDLLDYINETRKQILELKSKNKSENNEQPTANNQQLFLSTGSSDKFQNTMQKLTAQLKKQNRRIKDIKQIRTSVISNWLKQYNLRKVQVMAGHRYVSSTEAYQINNMDDLKEDINKYHPIA